MSGLALTRLESWELSKPRVVLAAFFSVFWVMAVLPYLMQEVSQDLYKSAGSYLQFAGDAVVILLGLWLLRAKADWILFGAYLVISVWSTVFVNAGGLMQWANGSRIWLPMLLVVPVLRYLWATEERREAFIYWFDRSVFWFLCLQAPCLVEEAVRYGIGDHGGGSLGDNMSGVVSMLIYGSSFYLILRRWNPAWSYLKNLGRNWILLVLLLPTFLNETKVSLVLMPLYLFLLVPVTKGYGRRLALLSPVFAALIAGGGWLYFKSTDSAAFLSKDAMEFYLMGDDAALNMIELLADNDIMERSDGGETDLARGLKFAAVPLIMERHPGTVWTGFGVGQFKGGSVLETTRFSRDYDWLIEGTKMMGMVWVTELGLPGLLWAIAFFIVLFRGFGHLKGRQTRFQVYLWANLALSIVYGATFMNLPFTIMFVAFAFLSGRWPEVMQAGKEAEE